MLQLNRLTQNLSKRVIRTYMSSKQELILKSNNPIKKCKDQLKYKTVGVLGYGPSSIILSNNKNIQGNILLVKLLVNK